MPCKLNKLQTALKGKGGSGGADFCAVDHEDIDVAPRIFPAVREIGETIECLRVVPRWDVLAHALEAGISEVCRNGFDARIVI